MKYLFGCLFKLNHPQIVIPAQAGIQTGDMPSLVFFSINCKNIRFAYSSLKVSLMRLLVDWIPAYAGMTGFGTSRGCL